MSTNKLQEFLTAHFENAIGSEEHPTFQSFSWFEVEERLCLNLCAGDKYASVSVDFTLDPNATAFGACGDGAQGAYETHGEFRDGEPSSFRIHAEHLEDLREVITRVAHRAHRAWRNRPDQMF